MDGVGRATGRLFALLLVVADPELVFLVFTFDGLRWFVFDGVL